MADFEISEGRLVMSRERDQGNIDKAAAKKAAEEALFETHEAVVQEAVQSAKEGVSVPSEEPLGDKMVSTQPENVEASTEEPDSPED